jgi:hypothetical protein
VSTAGAVTRDPDGLVSFALESLRPMELPSGLFCHHRARGRAEPVGVSLRYTLMVLLGLHEAERGGRHHVFDLARIWNAASGRLDAAELVPGDLGLFLWAAAVGGRDGADELAQRLEQALPAAGGLVAREGMEPAWIVQGAALQLAAGAGAAHERHLRQGLDVLLRNQAPSGLLHHSGTGRRRRFPNFATQIYGVLALSTVARLGFDDRALPAARRIADALLGLQLGDGGWPWIYDARAGRVVERYEVYSVHQHAMAPMGLLALAAAAQDERYAHAARRGLEWIHGRNELGLDMVDAAEGLIYRSVRRRKPLDRVALYANTAAAALIRRPVLGAGGVELFDITCSYELGWLVYAWAARGPAG